MKKITTFLLATFAVAAMSFAQNINDGEQRAVGVARAEVQGACLAGIPNLQVSVTENYNCNIFDGYGINRTVYFYTGPQCIPNQPCPAGPIRLLAEVTVDCDFTVESSKCYLTGIR